MLCVRCWELLQPQILLSLAAKDRKPISVLIAMGVGRKKQKFRLGSTCFSSSPPLPRIPHHTCPRNKPWQQSLQNHRQPLAQEKLEFWAMWLMNTGLRTQSNDTFSPSPHPRLAGPSPMRMATLVSIWNIIVSVDDRIAVSEDDSYIVLDSKECQSYSEFELRKPWFFCEVSQKLTVLHSYTFSAWFRVYEF